MTPRQQRLALIFGGLVALAIAAALVLSAFKDNLVFFFTPTQITAGEAPVNRAFRVGGMLKTGSVVKDATDPLTTEFVITDTAQEVKVRYTGILPDLFSEGKGVVAQGKLNDQGLFTATEVLAKHDENYMPPEAQAAMDAAKAAKMAETVQ